MKKNLIFLFILVMLGSNVGLSFEKIKLPFKIRLNPISDVPKGGSFQVELIISPMFECKQIDVTIKTFGSIIVSKENSWQDNFKNKDSLRYYFDVTIPDLDTTGFEVRVQSGKIWHHAFLYFVTTGEEVEVFKGNPRFEPIDLPTKMILEIEGDKGEKLPSELPGYKQGLLGKELKTSYDPKNDEERIFQQDETIKSTLDPQKKDNENDLLYNDNVPSSLDVTIEDELIKKTN